MKFIFLLISLLARKLKKIHGSNHLQLFTCAYNWSPKTGVNLRIFFIKRIRGAGCVVRVTGLTARLGESVTAERETAPVDTFQAGQILSVIARETYTVSKLPKQRCRLTASLAQSEGRSAIISTRLCRVWGSLLNNGRCFLPKQIRFGQCQRIMFVMFALFVS